MGWSCGHEAGNTLSGMFGECANQTGRQNVYVGRNGARYILEPSRKEHRDGAVTGQVWKESAPAYTDAGGYERQPVKNAGSFRIEGDNGVISRKPSAWPFPSAGACERCNTLREATDRFCCRCGEPLWTAI